MYHDIAKFARDIVLSRGGLPSDIPQQSVDAIWKLSDIAKIPDVIHKFELIARAQRALQDVGDVNNYDSATSGEEDEVSYIQLQAEESDN